MRRTALFSIVLFTVLFSTCAVMATPPRVESVQVRTRAPENRVVTILRAGGRRDLPAFSFSVQYESVSVLRIQCDLSLYSLFSAVSDAEGGRA